MFLTMDAKVHLTMVRWTVPEVSQLLQGQIPAGCMSAPVVPPFDRKVLDRPAAPRAVIFICCWVPTTDRCEWLYSCPQTLAPSGNQHNWWVILVILMIPVE